MINSGKRETSIATRLIYARLAKTEIGDHIPYGELSRIAGETISGSSHYLRTALRMAQRENGIEYECIRGHGITRLDSRGMVQKAAKARTEIRRKAKRAISVLGNVTVEELSDDQKVTFNAQMTVYELFRRSAREKEFLKLEQRVKSAGEAIPAQKLLVNFVK